MSRSAHRWLLVVGAVLLMLPPLVWQQSRTAPRLGTPPGESVDEAAGTEELDDLTASAAAKPPTTSAPGHKDVGDQAPGTRPAKAPSPPNGRPFPPVAISLPALGVTAAPVDAVGLDPDGAVDLPDDVRRVGWYQQGPRPGEAGNAFFTSHVDSRTQGPGVLFDLNRSQLGDRVEVIHADGSISSWQVVARERVDKGSYPMQRVFRFDGEPGLVIDTCGGRFDASTGSYEHIDIVYAVPVD